MTPPTPPASQEELENVSLPRSPAANHEASPTLPSLSRQSKKERKPPTITPRTFTRFFTPKSLSSKQISSSRRALRELSSSATNSRSRRALRPDRIIPEGLSASSGAKRRKLQSHVATEVELSSPIKRIHNQTLDVSEAEASEADFTDQECNDSVPHSPTRIPRRLKHDPFGSHLSRELYGPRLGHRLHQKYAHHNSEWQSETANFFSKPEDVHASHHVENDSDSIPFCATPCNSKYQRRSLLDPLSN